MISMNMQTNSRGLPELNGLRSSSASLPFGNGKTSQDFISRVAYQTSVVNVSAVLFYSFPFSHLVACMHARNVSHTTRKLSKYIPPVNQQHTMLTWKPIKHEGFNCHS